MDKAAETRGLAIAGVSLAQAALSFMHGARLISNEQLDELLESVLSGIETTLPPDDPGVEYAQKFVENIGAIVRRRPMQPKRGG